LRKRHAERIAFDHGHSSAAGEAPPQLVGLPWIQLDRLNARPRSYQLARQSPRPSADVEHELVLLDVRARYDGGGKPLTEEVPVRCAVRGVPRGARVSPCHGRSP